ncbi:putative PX domain-containing protein [Rosellinia necatrix]|uniref:Putative PX domain-containing protein n=1 Tax=Rosellinia necatrix TaxID=77044 RepID=A0A1W2TWL7_ROSNE|nr:putative PX domain-containing protein [Rosellinia necatrix]
MQAHAEISIPTTSLHTPADGSKPYTLYNITLRLPVRTLIIQKRYSEFATLHTTLTSLVGSPPPASLPAKTWFKSTLTSPELTEDRRRQLEAYLCAIAESPDRRWRDTPAWRSFLTLPPLSTANSAASVRGGYGIPNRDAANAAAAEDPGTWLDLHGEMKRDLQEARRFLAKRDAATENAVALEAGSAAKKALVKAGGLLTCLRDGLKTIESARRIGDGEIRRRKDLLAAARVDREDLEKLSLTIFATAKATAKGAPSASDKAALFGAAASKTRGRVLGAPLPETEQTRELDNEGVAQLQKQLMEDQDRDVEALGKIIRRQREMAEGIDREVMQHIEILDHVNAQADVLGSKVGVAKKRLGGMS